MTHLSINSEAETEIDEAAAFYDQRAAGLGLRFVLAVRRCLDVIERDPGRFPVRYGHRRHALVGDFPYSVIYRWLEPEIRVLAVAHTRRHPTYWRKRT